MQISLILDVPIDTTNDTTTISVSNKIESITRVFPNPADDIVTIEGLDEAKKIEIKDITGKVIKVINSVNKTKVSVNISEFEHGIYFMSIHKEKGTEITKLLIE